MYFPPNFDCNRAIELGRLVNQAYQQFQCFKQGKPWQIADGYTLACEIFYSGNTLMAMKSAELTILEKEIRSLGDKLQAKQNIPFGFVAQRNCNVYLVFRGTETTDEWVRDIKMAMVSYPIAGWGKVHKGFLEDYNRLQKGFINSIKRLDKNLNFLISGHSLGGALSLLVVPEITTKTNFQKPSLYNFGCPRIGDNTFVTAYNNLMTATKSFRINNTSDLVPSVPLPVPLPFFGGGYYSHVDTPVDFTTQDEDILKNHSMDTYLAALNG